MWILDNIGRKFRDFQFAVAKWIDRIDDSMWEMTTIRRYLIDIGNALAKIGTYFFDLSDDYDQLTERAKDAILGSYYNLNSWLDSRQAVIMSWSSDLWKDIRGRMEEVETQLSEMASLGTDEITSWFEGQEEKVIGWVENRAEDILDRMFD